MTRAPLWTLLLVLSAARCTNGDGKNSAGAGWTRALDQVVVAERAFARMAADSTVQTAFRTFLADDALIFRPGPVPGRSWIDEHPFPRDLVLEWEPAWADVSLAGDLGFTTGPWHTASRSHSDSITAWGQYVTLWRNTGGSWRAVLDFGSEAPPPPASVRMQLASQPITAGSVATDSASLREALRIADEDLNEAVATSGTEAWAAYTVAAVRWLRPGRPPAIGVDAAADAAPARNAATLGSVVSLSGDLGYSWGAQRGENGTGEAGAMPIAYYVRIWRRQPNGSWKVVLDATSGASG